MTAPNPLPPVGQTWVLSEANLESEKEVEMEWREPVRSVHQGELDGTGGLCTLQTSGMLGKIRGAYALVSPGLWLWNSTQDRPGTLEQAIPM